VDKKSLRQEIRKQRWQLDYYEQQLASDLLTTNVITSKLLLKFNRVACYLANDGEIDTHSLIETLWSLKKQVYLPIVSHLPGTPLWFAPFNPGTKLKINSFGIPEPDIHPRKRIAARQLDLILMPLVAFDATGNRLGMGQGYYDRSLKFLNHRKFWRRPLLAGIAYNFQCVKKIESETWDIPLNFAITDQKFISF
jgi:5-formyltetrahydrofolate cyclo-ligase